MEIQTKGWLTYNRNNVYSFFELLSLPKIFTDLHSCIKSHEIVHAIRAVFLCSKAYLDPIVLLHVLPAHRSAKHYLSETDIFRSVLKVSISGRNFFVGGLQHEYETQTKLATFVSRYRNVAMRNAD